jgi:hypothetical protein
MTVCDRSEQSSVDREAYAELLVGAVSPQVSDSLGRSTPDFCISLRVLRYAVARGTGPLAIAERTSRLAVAARFSYVNVYRRAGPGHPLRACVGVDRISAGVERGALPGPAGSGQDDAEDGPQFPGLTRIKRPEPRGDP